MTCGDSHNSEAFEHQLVPKIGLCLGNHRRRCFAYISFCQGVPAALPLLPSDSRDLCVTFHVGCTAGASRSGMASAWASMLTIHRCAGCI